MVYPEQVVSATVDPARHLESDTNHPAKAWFFISIGISRKASKGVGSISTSITIGQPTNFKCLIYCSINSWQEGMLLT
jgi:hypothetical protein